MLGWMKFSLSILMLTVAVIAIAFATLANPSDIALQLLRLILVALGCVALCVAVNSIGRRRRASSTFGIFAIVMLSLNAGPESLGTFFNLLLNPEYDAEDPFTYSFHLLSISRVWFAFFVAIIAAAVASSPIFSNRSEQ